MPTDSQYRDSDKKRACLLRLPSELRAQILELACCGSSASSSPTDSDTAFKLCLVSKAIRAQVQKILYEVISITTPSALMELFATLQSRPDLGGAVKALHIGPASHLHPRWWPMQSLGDLTAKKFKKEGAWITHSIRDEGLLPHGCSLERKWRLGASDDDLKCFDDAVYDALIVAQVTLKVNLMQCRSELDGSCSLSSAVWLMRVLELQAVLDLYLTEMRRLEDRQGRAIEPCRRIQEDANDVPSCSTCVAYPALRLELPHGPLISEQDDELVHSRICSVPAHIITYAQIREHLDARGAATDHFHHPIIFARSNLLNCIADISTRGVYDESKLPGARLTATGRNSGNRETGGAATTATLIRAARSILRQLAKLQDLSVTGFLSYALKDMLGQLVSVSSLSIGPLTARRNGTCLVILDDAGLCSLEQLRICGLDGAEQATAFITSRSLAPRLASVQWDMRKAPASPHRVAQLIQALEQRITSSVFSSPEENTSILSSLERCRVNSRDVSHGQHRQAQQSIDILLQPFVLATMLSLGNSKENGRTIWTTGVVTHSESDLLRIVKRDVREPPWFDCDLERAGV